MATPASDIYDLFMQRVSDYRLTTLFNTSESDFENFLEAWLIFAIGDFEDICDQSLSFSNGSFSSDLTTRNKIILSHLMEKFWMKKNVNDITQMNLHVGDRDFKVASEAQNLKAKQDYLTRITEECSQVLQDYAYNRVNWNSWLNQEFMGG